MSFVSYSDKIIRLSQLFIFQEMKYILKSADKFLQYLLGTDENSVHVIPLLILLIIFLLRLVSLKILRLCNP